MGGHIAARRQRLAAFAHCPLAPGRPKFLPSAAGLPRPLGGPVGRATSCQSFLYLHLSSYLLVSLERGHFRDCLSSASGRVARLSASVCVSVYVSLPLASRGPKKTNRTSSRSANSLPCQERRRSIGALRPGGRLLSVGLLLLLLSSSCCCSDLSIINFHAKPAGWLPAGRRCALMGLRVRRCNAAAAQCSVQCKVHSSPLHWTLSIAAQSAFSTVHRAIYSCLKCAP